MSITSNDQSLTQDGDYWKKDTAGVDVVNLVLRYTKGNSTSVTIKALREAHNDRTKKPYIGMRQNDGKVIEWFCYRDTDTIGDGISIPVGIMTSDKVIYFEFTVADSSNETIDISASIDSTA